MSATLTESRMPVVLPVREDIELKPNRQFPRTLCVEWGALRSSVRIQSKKWKTFASARVDNSRISLWACRLTEPHNVTVYSLDAGEATFHLTQREFDTLREKLEPRGVKVVLPKESRS